MSQRICADLYIRIMEQILHKKEKSKKVKKSTASLCLHSFTRRVFYVPKVPTLLYLMSSTSKKQRKFQSSVTCEFLILFLLERTYNKTASNQTVQTRTTRIMIYNSLPNPHPHEYLQVTLRKNKKQKRKRTWKSIPRKRYLLDGSCVCVCVCV